MLWWAPRHQLVTSDQNSSYTVPSVDCIQLIWEEAHSSSPVELYCFSYAFRRWSSEHKLVIHEKQRCTSLLFHCPEDRPLKQLSDMCCADRNVCLTSQPASNQLTYFPSILTFSLLVARALLCAASILLQPPWQLTFSSSSDGGRPFSGSHSMRWQFLISNFLRKGRLCSSPGRSMR